MHPGGCMSPLSTIHRAYADGHRLHFGCPETKAGVCVSTVSIVGVRDGHAPRRTRSHQSQQTGFSSTLAGAAGAACATQAPLSPMLLTVLTVLTVFS
jgi:hypothetical protein